MISDSFKKSAQAELLRMRHERTSLDEKIAALESLVNEKRDAGTITTTKITLPLDPSMGLAEAIRITVARNAAGMRPVEVAKSLRENGFKQTGSVPFNGRVAGEMARLKRTGKLHKDSNGLYELPDRDFL